jgi:hypothetical protein
MLAIFLVICPNLKELRLANSWVVDMHVAVFNSVCVGDPEGISHFDHHDYLEDIMFTLCLKLEGMDDDQAVGNTRVSSGSETGK